jgi:hypothetical protein
LKVLVPAVDSFFVGFQAESIQFSLVYAAERNFSLPGGAKFGFFGE